MSIYVQSNQIISELRCHRNLLTSSKTVPLCLKQVLVVRTSLIQISDTRTSFLTILRFLCVIFFIIWPDFNPSVWHTQRMTNFVTIFLWGFFAPVWHSLYGATRRDAMRRDFLGPITFSLLIHTRSRRRERYFAERRDATRLGNVSIFDAYIGLSTVTH